MKINEWDKWQTRPLEDALQKRVEELENRLKQALHFDDDTADGYDWQVLESAFKYDDLRASISKAVEDVQKLDRHNVRIGDFMSIFQKHGLIGEQK